MQQQRDWIAMSAREQRRAHVLARVVAGELKLWEAAVVLGLSVRHTRRLKRGLVRDGPAALAHANRGRGSPRRLSPTLRQHVVELYLGPYRGLNHQHFCELLDERERLKLSVASARRILRAAGLGSPQTRRPAPHRARRQRMPAEGMLLQLDGSPHRWLGPDGPRWSLLSAVDDATGEPVAALFREQEDTAGYLMLLREVVTSRGIPAAIYRDRHSIFRAPGSERLSLEEQLTSGGDVRPTQVGRVLAELGIESIAAASPQAKGRIERSWRTHQDRLVAELRLAGVSTLEHANAFLPGYLERYRARFVVPAASAESAYVPLRPGTDVDRLFCCKYTRTVANDNTLRFAGQVLQLLPGRDRLSYARAVVEVHQRLDGSLAIVHHAQLLLHVPAPADARPIRTATRGKHLLTPSLPASPPPPSAPPPAPRSRRQPALTHPWKQSYQRMRPLQRTLPWIA
jgi:transposase